MIISSIPDARVVSKQAFTRQAGDNKVTKIRVCANPARKNDRNPTRFLNAEAWGAVGDGLARLSKGDVVFLSGELKLDKYTDKTGTERTDDVLSVTHFRVVKSDSFFNDGKQADPEPSDPEQMPETDDSIPF